MDSIHLDFGCIFMKGLGPSLIQNEGLFQSLLFEACGRTVNPVNGAVGLLWTGNWHLCQSAVETVLRGGVLRPLPKFSGLIQSPEFDEGSEANNTDLYKSQDLNLRVKREGFDDGPSDLNLGLAGGFPEKMTAGRRKNRPPEERRPASPSDESETTTLESGLLCNQELQQNHPGRESKLLRLFF
ncbi:LOB domain-containing protein 39-like [Olea europaea var. sylvestris]|uniref:LOB domain-containing protein 39-like n=1 Tax=Olea europaea var. sylvestris TaxID=158386 RepID=UPI000C1D67FD|nr:LOB domain-containing protein 39-like [Olea europaea var. sylvestris]